MLFFLIFFQFFSILRAHFLESFDGCEYGRCNVQPYDYGGLQYWLFEFHNGVTRRIYKEKLLYIYNDPLIINEKNAKQENIEKIESLAMINVENRMSEIVKGDISYPSLLSCPYCMFNVHDDAINNNINTINNNNVLNSNNIVINSNNNNDTISINNAILTPPLTPAQVRLLSLFKDEKIIQKGYRKPHILRYLRSQYWSTAWISGHKDNNVLNMHDNILHKNGIARKGERRGGHMSKEKNNIRNNDGGRRVSNIENENENENEYENEYEYGNDNDNKNKNKSEKNSIFKGIIKFYTKHWNFHFIFVFFAFLVGSIVAISQIFGIKNLVPIFFKNDENENIQSRDKKNSITERNVEIISG